MNSTTATVPLCVDCDGTLIRTDLLHESVFLLLKHAPWKLVLLPWWLLRGKAFLKERLAQAVQFDWSTLPLNEEVVALARQAREAGRPVVLATASHRLLAEPLARHLGLFDDVLATDGPTNLSGSRKSDQLSERFGPKGFDYVGNDRKDLPVWSAARQAVVVSSDVRLIEAAKSATRVSRVIPSHSPGLRAYLKALRLHQWLKNVLVFVPLVAAHRLTSSEGLVQALLGFLAFGLCASAVYVLNDLVDLEADRRHVRKRNRPFASGLIPVWHGAFMIPALLGASFATAWWLPIEFVGVLAGYFLCTLAYSLALKRQVVVDVLMLAGLYTLRVVAGGAATGIVPSFWLLAFSMFIFLSLALVKRYSELLVTLQQDQDRPSGRGYTVTDLPVLMSVGTSAGMVAVLVFALYINNPDIPAVYDNPLWLWLVPPLLLYWVSRLWMKTHRGEVDDDPLVFALRDWQSLTVVGLSAVLFSVA
ncbi:MAG: membrane protein [Caldimonas sp.]|uniref:UbiA family prenyltransferase n=1 Tax=Caldimonas taiwanensis TaxID=307483 RepID=UPI0007835AB5|nr:UbiA family prenyltransferase [Caldimonas taiwanensis]GIX23391.1 MAG: membrane protein [Caldimonas sp.]